MGKETLSTDTLDQVNGGGIKPEVPGEKKKTTPMPFGFGGHSNEPMRFHVVQSNENLFSISALYGVTIQALRSANDLPPTATEVKSGTTLMIP